MRPSGAKGCPGTEEMNDNWPSTGLAAIARLGGWLGKSHGAGVELPAASCWDGALQGGQLIGLEPPPSDH
ncbi:hypothetical protein ZHAS_00014512 [Anopheles sinensis]|uniref:Uncharacterized protein n=1 Tax=Anopheles sinensis TaxID=74873 RepID=A0A084W8H6_ANOSI|nr:hypothetical protein ZHAS_00014512 [Anopheles sinensis]